MTKKLRIVLAQLNLTVGDIQGNLAKHIDAAIAARDQLGADIIVFPELSLTGYPPEDLLLRPAFIAASQTALQTFIAKVKNIYALVGHPSPQVEGLTNACSMIYNGAVLAHYAKQLLPNYGVFDEDRYFVPGTSTCVVTIKNIPVGILICEDLWEVAPTARAVQQGARLILSPNASPFEIDKHDRRLLVLAERASANQIPIVYVNQVGGQDELIFDGGSMVVNAQGHPQLFAGFFNEILLPVDIDFEQQKIVQSGKLGMDNIPSISREEKVYQALVLALRDYVNKNNFASVLIGVSGGIDSALTLAIAVDALGSERVRALMMPSAYTAPMSIEDALLLTKTLKVKSETISIEPLYQQILSTLAPSFQQRQCDATEENIQARCRAILLMALSNKYGHLVLTTSNRSEVAVGYCTLYGDMAGGFAVLKDVPKTLVYQLSRYRNRISPVIPERILTRPPTAELAPNQKDEDTLPPYPILDAILEAYLNEERSVENLIQQGFDKEVVMKIITLIRNSEYKRSQSAIGPRINAKSFGKDWRYPLTNGFKG